MARSHSNEIAPFPPDIDRGYFAAYLSGFTDGEGCFMAATQYHRDGHWYAKTTFKICLRADDAAVIKMIQSFWGCGRLDHQKGKPTRWVRNPKPQLQLTINRASDQRNILLPHFRRFPLLAKKAADFSIWAEAVELRYRVARRSQRQACWSHNRLLPKWTQDERNRFQLLVDQLKVVRRFDLNTKQNVINLPPALAEAEIQQHLFPEFDP